MGDLPGAAAAAAAAGGTASGPESATSASCGAGDGIVAKMEDSCASAPGSSAAPPAAPAPPAVPAPLPPGAVAATPPPHVAAVSAAERQGSVHNLLSLARTSATHPPQAPATDSGGSGNGAAPGPPPPPAPPSLPGGSTLQNTINAIELLHVVEADETWQQAERSGGSLQGGSAALLTVIHSSGPGRHSPEAPSRKRSANGSDGAVAGRRQFGFPGGGTFMRAAPVSAAAAPPSRLAALQDKVLRAEGYHTAAAAPTAAAPLPHGATAPHRAAAPAAGATAGHLSAPHTTAARPSSQTHAPFVNRSAATDAAAEEEDKAIRGRLNRIDGGVGRRLTLDSLQTQFGKGLKDAAEALGMCPTTLKRACRRLGVKRWPRTADAAAEVLAEARAAAAAAGAGGAAAGGSAPGAAWPDAQLLPVDDAPLEEDEGLGEFLGLLDDEDMLDSKFA